MDTLENLNIFITNHEGFWRERPGVRSVPSRATLRRVLALIDGQAVGEVMAALLRERLGTAGAVVAVDGKGFGVRWKRSHFGTGGHTREDQ